jgi:peroxiredoxin 5
MVKAGDFIPAVELVENSPGNLINLSKEIGTGNALIIGIPAAFSMVLSYLSHEVQH